MSLALITVKQVVILFLLILAGTVCVRTGVVKIEGRKAFSDILIYLIVPAMILQSYMTEYRPEILMNLLQSLLWSFVLLGVGIAITMLLTCKMKWTQTPILRFSCIFSNAAYMGFPLIQALFGAEGLMYASVYVTAFNILLWTLGYAMVSGRVQVKAVLKTVLTTPVLISVVIGIVIYLTQVPLPEIITQPIRLIGNMNTPLSMFITGMIIAVSNFGKMVHDRRIWRVVLIKMFLIPAAGYAVLMLFGIHGMVAQVVLLLESCPSAAITSVFAVQFGYEEDFAAGTVVITTFLSILTLPLVAMLL